MVKRILSLLFLSRFCVLGWSQSVLLTIHAKSGAKVSYALSEKPVVTYQGNVLVLTTPGTTMEYPLSDLQMFTFSGSTNAVESVTMEPSKGDGTVRIYNMSGVLVRTIKPSGDRSADTTFSTQDLPSGIYIIKQGRQTYKITKK